MAPRYDRRASTHYSRRMGDMDRIAALEATVAELRALLDAARPRHRDSMRRTLCCPACGERAILHVPNVHERSHAGAAVAFRLGIYRSFWGAMGGVKVDAYVCEACRLVEWYTVEPLVVDGEHVKRLEVAPDGERLDEPYR
jgi:hypothetical protein